MAQPDFVNFHKSITHELLAVKDRVRSILWDRNWTDDGKFKEAILRKVISRTLPDNYSIGTGHVITYNPSAKEYEISKQIDIVIYENKYPVLFKEGDFIIVTGDSVRAIIEVKTKIETVSELLGIIETSEENANPIKNTLENKQFFNGIFSFETDIPMNDNLKDPLEEHYLSSTCEKNRQVNHISLGKEIFIKFGVPRSQFLSIYKLEELGFAYFISNLTYGLDITRNQFNERFFFPLPSKEPHNQYKIDLDPEKTKKETRNK